MVLASFTTLNTSTQRPPSKSLGACHRIWRLPGPQRTSSNYSMRIGSREGTRLPRISGHEYQRRQAGEAPGIAADGGGQSQEPVRRSIQGVPGPLRLAACGRPARAPVVRATGPPAAANATDGERCASGARNRDDCHRRGWAHGIAPLAVAALRRELRAAPAARQLGAHGWRRNAPAARVTGAAGGVKCEGTGVSLRFARARNRSACRLCGWRYVPAVPGTSGRWCEAHAVLIAPLRVPSARLILSSRQIGVVPDISCSVECFTTRSEYVTSWVFINGPGIIGKIKSHVHYIARSTPNLETSVRRDCDLVSHAEILAKSTADRGLRVVHGSGLSGIVATISSHAVPRDTRAARVAASAPRAGGAGSAPVCRTCPARWTRTRFA